MGRLQIRDFNASLVQDPFVRMDKMKVTMHAKVALKIPQPPVVKDLRSLRLDEQFPCMDAR
jgi:hypothetical protein